uniref:NADH-ubiquinone oxidoreductase chain 1 n=1 Tax=Candidozyma auris TaxID=498019 RepID=A0A510GIZ8_CANAR|nr:NADH dehydrogenase subunit 1 [[Candida] auris]QNR39898.1 NADH dehydrogenase subunit 1 [[Candida] auris]WDD58105.1 NAD1 [[Candida] auris]WDD58116.1 NAD1 [[Candida] auris]WDD58127.1 NAD1 [[Candida] auris]WDD58138.1 NAD1 [[Candida] auris]
MNMMELLMLFVSMLLAVAFLTVAERKTLGYMQRRVGPNAVGYYGTLMAMADAAKLLLKEMIMPTHADKVMLLMSPMMALMSALLCWSVMPFGPGMVITDHNYGFILTLAISSVGVFGTLLAGWSANSKYSLLGSMRSTAQLISYELVLTTMMLLCILLAGSMNLSRYVELQKSMWMFLPLLPLSMMWFMGCVAECARPPFDNVEAESELVSGHMTEYSSSMFVTFFLSEYASMLFLSTLTAMLFFGGGTGMMLGLKANVFAFTYIWVRATLPRVRYDKLINMCWIIFLPLLFALALFMPALMYAMDANMFMTTYNM